MLNARYRLGELLGEGGFGRTYAAFDERDGTDVVVKELRFQSLSEWKPLDAFEREVRVLRSLEHSGISAFVDAFNVEEEGNLCFYLVTERVPGMSLAKAIESGVRWGQREAEDLVRRSLEILAYLHQLSPPVVHRDITPGNLLLRHNREPVLVDFGAVRELLTSRGRGAVTVLGTPGYMAPEQGLGVTAPSCDLYGLGMTLMHVFTHCHPADLPRDGMRIRFSEVPGLAPDLRRVLESLCEPDPQARCASAQAALTLLSEGDVQPGTPAKQRSASENAHENTQLVVPSLAALALPPAPRTPDPGREARLKHSEYSRRTKLYSVAIPSMILVMMTAFLTAATYGLGMFLPLLSLCAFGVVPVLLEWRLRERVRGLYRNGELIAGRMTKAIQAQQGSFVHYEFELDGKTRQGRVYTNDAIVLHGLRRGAELPVFYDPERPDRHIALLDGTSGEEA